MTHKYFLIFLFLFFFNFGFSQTNDNFGKLTQVERQMSFYDKDVDASAVVLYEKGTDSFKEIRSKLFLIKTFHSRIKILNKNGLNQGEISITLYEEEELSSIKAITNNIDSESELQISNIYTTKENDYITTKKFSFPNVKVGSIIEYSYEITSPYYNRLDGWDFQSDIPKIQSEYHAKIPGLFKFNRALVGSLKLDQNTAHVEKSCLRSAYYYAECEVLEYTMKDIPALQYQDGYSLSSKNYSSRIRFEIAKISFRNNSETNKPRTWKEIDRSFKANENIGPQLLKTGYFKKLAPEDIFNGKNQLEKAENIYHFIRNHFSSNGSNGFYTFKNVKKAFKEKKGSVAEINMSLITLLNEAGIDTKLMILSTREKGLPRRSYATLSDFNYFIAISRINGQTYLLDASDKNLPFGMIPFNALNHYGRVMNFEGPSYWQDIKPNNTNIHQIRTRVLFDNENEKFSGVMNVINLGYKAVENSTIKRRLTEEEYIHEFSKKTQDNIDITAYSFSEEISTEMKTSEQFEFTGNKNSVNDRIYFNPFLVKLFEENPFQLEQRNYPIDFGYPREYKYQITVKIPEGYEVDKLPIDNGIKLGDNMAIMTFSSIKNDSNVLVSFKLSINHPYFSEMDYSILKNMFNKAIDIQSTSLLVFKKK